MFRKFVRLSAGRIGQIFSASSLANSVGVSVATIQSWISVLISSYIVMLLEPYHANIGKRLIKSPKLYFYDVGFASYLLGLENADQVERDPLKGNLFENMVLMEIVKHRNNQGLDHKCNFYRDSNGNEVDILFKYGRKLIPIEIKSAETFHGDFIKNIQYLKKVFPGSVEKGYCIYAGKKEQIGKDFTLLNFHKTQKVLPTTSR